MGDGLGWGGGGVAGHSLLSLKNKNSIESLALYSRPKIHSCHQGFTITSPKTISPTFTILEILMPTVYPIVEQTLRNFQFFFQGPKFFNLLDNKVINSTSISSFKKTLKSNLIKKLVN